MGRPPTEYKIVVRRWESGIRPCVSCHFSLGQITTMCLCVCVCVCVCACLHLCVAKRAVQVYNFVHVCVLTLNEAAKLLGL